MSDALIAAWRGIILGDDKSWVLFENGTCVVLMEPGDDLAEQAIGILKETGPVHAGSSHGDFSTITLEGPIPGWVVTSHHPDVLTYVGPDECDESDGDLVVGLCGRSKRGQDAEDLQVVHVEDNR